MTIRQRRWWTTLVAAVLAVAATLHGATDAIASPDGVALPPAAQAQIAATIGADDPDYHARQQGDETQVYNAKHGVSATFSADGVAFARLGNRWTMTLRGHGYGHVLTSARAATPIANANRVEYRRGATTEWYVNGPLGIEQGITLSEAPAGSNGEPLTVAFTLEGNLTPSSSVDRRALTLTRDGIVALRYAALTAWDANGRELPSWLEVDGRELRLRVNDAGAKYPLTIDPYVQAPTLTAAKPCDAAAVCDDFAPWAEFGYSLSLSADASTVVVGAPGKYFNNSQIQRGVAYVFAKPADFEGGWSGGIGPNYFKTKLLASEPLTTHLVFADAVDISRDASTIVVGGRGVGAYVYLRPAAGWGSFATQTQNARLTAVPHSNETNYFIGMAVAISGDGATIAVGALGHTIDSVRRGAAYVYLKPPTGWVNAFESQKFTGSPGSEYGHSIALSDDAKLLVVGATGSPYSEPSVPYGTAYVLARFPNPGSADFYATVAELNPSLRSFDDRYGSSVSVDGLGNTVVVGSPLTPGFGWVGAAYVYTRPSGGWGTPNFAMTETAALVASDSVSIATGLGWAVDISVDGRTVVAGSGPGGVDPNGQTAAYFFAKPNTGWVNATESAKALPWDALLEDWFGSTAVSLSGDGAIAMVGAFGKEVDANVSNGVVYVFTGSATAPKAVVSPSSLTFAPQSIGTTSNAKTVTVTNTGNAPLHVTGVSALGQFTTTQNCVSASPIAPGASCSESVRFTPGSLGPFAGSLTFTDDSGGIAGALQTVSLQGEGKKVNTITLIESISAGRMVVNQSVAVNFEVKAEAGSTYLPNGTVIVQASTGESCSTTVLQQFCSLTFATARERTITVTFAGDSYANASTSSPVTIQVADFSLSASPSSQVAGPKKATFTVTVTPVSGSNGPLALTCNGGPANATCAFSPSSVSLGGGVVSAKATVSLPNGARPGTYPITFTGTFGSGSRSTTATLIVK